MKTQVIAITGAAGFIGSSLSRLLLNEGYTVIGIDNLAPNYPVNFKQENLQTLKKNKSFHFYKQDIRHQNQIENLLLHYKPVSLIHLAAMTGVRASLKQPRLYQNVNLGGTISVYQAALNSKVAQFVFSSSSSIYGNNLHVPFSETTPPDPRSPYAQSKLLAEQELRELAKAKLPVTILRLFSVYGPHGRPDMAPYLFTQAAYQQKPITQYGLGNTARDYTYVDDVINALSLVITKKIRNQTLNLGNSYPVKLTDLIKTIEKLTQKTLKTKILPQRQEEAKITWANIAKAKKILGWTPRTSFSTGMSTFINWYRNTRL